jgi:hypothetical protein
VWKQSYLTRHTFWAEGSHHASYFYDYRAAKVTKYSYCRAAFYLEVSPRNFRSPSSEFPEPVADKGWLLLEISPKGPVSGFFYNLLIIIPIAFRVFFNAEKKYWTSRTAAKNWQSLRAI